MTNSLVETIKCQSSDRFVLVLDCSRAKGPQTPTPTIVGRRLISPIAKSIHAVPRFPVNTLRIQDKTKCDSTQRVRESLIWLAGGDNEQPGIVIRAITMFFTAQSAGGVLKETTMVT